MATRIFQKTRQGSERGERLFGRGIYAGILMPAVVLVGLSAASIFSADTAADRLHRAQKLLWEGGDLQESHALFSSVLEDWPASPHAAEAHAGLGLLMEKQQSADSLLVAEAFRSAALLDPEAEEAGRWWMRAGEHFQRANQSDDAEYAYTQCIVTYPSCADTALIAVANLHLVDGTLDLALEYYQKATEASDPATARLARMGVSVTYEHLGDLDSALAELDEDEDASKERRLRLFQRQRDRGLSRDK